MMLERLEETRKFLILKIQKFKSSLDIQGVKYSNLPKSDGFKNNLIEIQVERLLELETKKYHLQTKIDDILEEFSKLPEISYKVIYYRHIDKLRWIDISKKIGYSVSQCHRFYSVVQKL